MSKALTSNFGQIARFLEDFPPEDVIEAIKSLPKDIVPGTSPAELCEAIKISGDPAYIAALECRGA